MKNNISRSYSRPYIIQPPDQLCPTEWLTDPKIVTILTRATH